MWTVEWYSDINESWYPEKLLETAEEAHTVLVLKKFNFPEWQWRILDPAGNVIT